MARIDPATLTRGQAVSMLADAVESADLARIAAGITKGETRRRYNALARQHGRNAIALADRLYGSPSADLAALSDDELLSALGE